MSRDDVISDARRPRPALVITAPAPTRSATIPVNSDTTDHFATFQTQPGRAVTTHRETCVETANIATRMAEQRGGAAGRSSSLLYAPNEPNVI